MESQYARRLRSGREFDHLFPRPNGNDHEISRKASVGDTVHFIREQVPKTLWQTKEVSKMLKGRNLNETCKNIWNFIYHHIQYQKDKEGVEQVRSPRRLWWERKGDCDCYTTTISSILFNLGIPHKYRITKYDREDPSEIRWQHIYPVVPINGRLDGKLERRGEYIVIDCVKDAYDAEQPYLEKQDFECNMKLNYLDGIEDEEMEGTEAEYVVPPNVDALDLAANFDEEDLGKTSWIKKATQKVGGAVKKVGKAIGKGIRFINRIANPATILLRNGFLLAMKENLFRLAGKLRFAYLTEQQAKKRGMNLHAFAKLKKVLEKAEKIYHGAGGKNENLKKAILNGRGNRDHKVHLSGLDGLEGEYADQEEYNILHTGSISGLGDLGEPATAATIAAATAALTAIGTALKSVKGLFPSGSKDAKEFEAEDNPAGAAVVGGNKTTNLIASAGNLLKKGKDAKNMVDSASSLIPHKNKKSQSSSSPPPFVPTHQRLKQHTAKPSSAETPSSVPEVSETSQALVETSNEVTTTNVTKEKPPTEEKKSLMKDPIGWVKENPMKAAIGVAGVAGLAYLGIKAINSGKKNGGVSGLSGLPQQVRRKKRKSKKGRKTTYRKSKIKAIKIL